MNSYQHPHTILVIHHEMIQRELGRNRQRDDRPRRRTGYSDRLRRTISRSLIALAQRIEPATSQSDRGLHAGMPH